MRLDMQQRISATECYICIFSEDQDAVIWPLEPIELPTEDNGAWTLGRWKVYVNAAPTAQIHSGRKTIYICHLHWPLLREDWQAIIKSEVDSTRAWDAWIERTER
jgi:hypothetical protein